MQFVALLLFCLVSWIPVALSQQDSSPPEDQDSSGDDLEISGSGSGDEGVISSNFGVELHTNTTPSLAPYLENTPVSLTTGPNHAVVVESEGPVVSQAPPTTPDEQEEVPKHPLLEQPTSVYPIGREKDATPVPTEAKPITKKVFQEVGTPHSPTTSVATITTTAAAVVKNVEVALKNTAAVPKVEDLPPAETTSLAITTATISQAIVPHITPGMPALNVRDTVATPAPSSVEPNDSKSRRMNKIDDEIVPEVATGLAAEGDSDIVMEDVQFGVQENTQSSSENQSLLDRKEVLAGVVAGGIVGLAFAVMLVSLMVYRMKKKDEGSYALDEQKHPNAGYQKPQRQEEFLA